MRSYDIESILKDEKAFSQTMKTIKQSCQILNITEPFPTDMKHMQFINKPVLVDILMSYCNRNSKRNTSSYQVLIQKAQEFEFKKTFGVNFSDYMSHIGKSQSFKKGVLSPITQLELGITKDPEIVAQTKEVIREIVKEVAFTNDASKFQGHKVDAISEKKLTELSGIDKVLEKVMLMREKALLNTSGNKLEVS